MMQTLKNKSKVKSVASCTKATKRTDRMDDTDYLLASPANKACLKESISQLKLGRIKDFKRVDC